MLRFKRKQTDKKVTNSSKTVSPRPEDIKLSYEVGNLQFKGSRDRQEDSFAFVNALDVTEIIKNGMLAIVADGMGGMNDGKRVSETAVSGFVNAFQSLDRQNDISSQLYDMVHQTNKLIYEQFGGDGGTTVVLVMIYQSEAYWVSVGDSSIYLKRDGGLYKLNRDHTYLNQLYLEELSGEEISRDRAENNEDKARLSEFMGKETIHEVDYNIRPLKLRVGDVLLLCSDGISSFITDGEIAAALEFSPTQACAHLEHYVRQQAHPKQDNYTGLIISVRN